MEQQLKRLKKRLLKDPARSRANRLRLFVLALVLGGGFSFTLTSTFDNWMEARRWNQVQRQLLKGAHEEAHRELSEGWAFEPHRIEALFHKGELEEYFLGKPRQALISYLSLIRDYPGTGRALEARKRVVSIYLERLYELDKALFHLEKLLSEAPQERAELLERLAELHFRVGRYERVLELSEELRKLPETDSTEAALSRLRQAASLHVLGHLQEAEKIYTQVAREAPGTAPGLEAVLGISRVAEDQNLLKKAYRVLQDFQGEDPGGEIARRKKLLERIMAQKQKAL